MIMSLLMLTPFVFDCLLLLSLVLSLLLLLTLLLLYGVVIVVCVGSNVVVDVAVAVMFGYDRAGSCDVGRVAVYTCVGCVILTVVLSNHTRIDIITHRIILHYTATATTNNTHNTLTHTMVTKTTTIQIPIRTT